MAYNKGYNPDALPAHAEPEQAAQMLSQSQASQNPPRTSSRPDYGKAAPAPPRDDRPHRDSYSRTNGPPPAGYGGGGGGRDPRYDDRRYNDRHDDRYGGGGRDRYDDGRGRYQDTGRPDPRYDDRPDPRFYSIGSPPPQSYGQGPPPQSHGRPPIQRPPPTPAPPRDENDRDALWRLFGTVDKDRSGQLSEAELRSALVNGDWTSFDSHTVRMMIRMFDVDRSGTISFDEFCGLWGFLSAWRGLFDRFDVDRSGTISYNEFSDALVAFGYRLSPQFVQLLFRTYDRRGENAIGFDLFVQACISLKRMTDVFKKYDSDRDGYITLSFEEFLTEIISQRG